MKEYQFDVYVKSPGKRGHHIKFLAYLPRKVADAVLSGILSSIDANGEDAGGGFSEVTRKGRRIASKAQEDKKRAHREAHHG